MSTEEIDVTVKVHLESWSYSDDWGCDAKTTYTDNNGQSIVLEYDNDGQARTIEEIVTDLRECLEDPETWWSEKIIQGNDLVLKIREAEKQMKHYQAEAKRSKEWAERHEKYAANCEQQLKELQSQVPQAPKVHGTSP